MCIKSVKYVLVWFTENVPKIIINDTINLFFKLHFGNFKP